NGRWRPDRGRSVAVVKLDLEHPCTLPSLVNLEDQSLRIDVGGAGFPEKQVGRMTGSLWGKGWSWGMLVRRWMTPRYR
ncbi:hypothetical protein U1Q18_032015, partial [Sarracenia purpurea var. burkii]